ncbi:hypothetical protein V8F06_005396, partial [Rhypophila decipiens]
SFSKHIPFCKTPNITAGPFLFIGHLSSASPTSSAVNSSPLFQSIIASSPSKMPALPPAKVACLKAAVRLSKETNDHQFLRLGTEISDRPLVLAHGRPAKEDMKLVMKKVRDIFGAPSYYFLSDAGRAVKACKTIWSDSAFPELDPDVLYMLAKSKSYTKYSIPDSHYRSFLVFLSSLAKNTNDLKQEMSPDESGFTFDEYKFPEMIEIAFDQAEQVLGKHHPDGAEDYYMYGGITSNRVLRYVKEVMGSIAVESNKVIEAGKEELEQFDILTSELLPCDDSPELVAVEQVREMHLSQTHDMLETLKTNFETLAQFLDGAITIIRGRDDVDDWKEYQSLGVYSCGSDSDRSQDY